MNRFALFLVIAVFSISFLHAQEEAFLSYQAGKVTPEQKKAIDQLLSDLDQIKGSSSVSQSQKDALADDLNQLFKDENAADPQKVDTLADHLGNAVVDNKITKVEKMQLLNDFMATMKSANLSLGESNAIIQDVMHALMASGVVEKDADHNAMIDYEALKKEMLNR